MINTNNTINELMPALHYITKYCYIKYNNIMLYKCNNKNIRIFYIFSRFYRLE